MLKKFQEKRKACGEKEVLWRAFICLPGLATTASFLCVSSKVFWEKVAQETKSGITLWLGTILDRYPKESKNTNAKRHMQPSVHSTIIHNSQSVEASQCPSTDGWIKRVWHVHTAGYYSNGEKNGMRLCRLQEHGWIWRHDAKGRNTSTVWYQLYVESKTVQQTSKYNKKSRLRENKLVVTREERQFRGRRLRGKNYYI